MPEQSARRRAIIALILSGIFPGLGQLYNRHHVKALAFLVAGVVLTWLFLRAVPADLLALAQPGADLILPLLVLLAVWLWSIIDARLGARR